MPLRALGLPALLALLALAPCVAAAELASGTLRLPLAPTTPQKALHLTATGLDPTKPVWVKFELTGISASEQLTGDLVLDAMPLEQPVPVGQTLVRFEAAKLTLKHPDAAVQQQLEAAAGGSSPLEQEARLGAAMAQALPAARSGKGTLVLGTQIRQYDAPGKPELTFSTSVERTQDIQPVAIQVTLGQGEPPVSAAERDRAYKKDKVWAGVFGLLFVLGFWWWRRKRNA